MNRLGVHTTMASDRYDADCNTPPPNQIIKESSVGPSATRHHARIRKSSSQPERKYHAIEFFQGIVVGR
jgi:hypothetical protein